MKHTLKRRLLTTLLATSLLTATATPAFAQEYQGPQFGTSSTTTWLGITVTTGAIVMIVIYLLKPSDGAALLQEYLQENQHAVAQDMAVGGGQSVDYLAGFFGVSPHHQDAFAEVLRHEYAVLAPMYTGEQVTIAQAGEFIAVITDAMMEHEGLRQDVLYWQNIREQQLQTAQ